MTPDTPEPVDGLVERVARAMAKVYSQDSMISGDCDWISEPNERDFEAARAALLAMGYDDGPADEQRAIAIAAKHHLDPITVIEVFETWLASPTPDLSHRRGEPPLASNQKKES
jgi:hypothetical protein